MDRVRRVRIPRSIEPSRSELAKQRVDVVGRDDNRLTKLAVPVMAGKNQLVSFAGEHAEGGIAQIVIAVHTVKIEYPGVERERVPHVPAANGRDDCHYGSRVSGRYYLCCAPNALVQLQAHLTFARGARYRKVLVCCNVR